MLNIVVTNRTVHTWPQSTCLKALDAEGHLNSTEVEFEKKRFGYPHLNKQLYDVSFQLSIKSDAELGHKRIWFWFDIKSHRLPSRTDTTFGQKFFIDIDVMPQKKEENKKSPPVIDSKK